jgi:hypothetical protein
MLFRPGWAVLIAVALAAPAILAQDTGTAAAKPKKPAMSTEPWPDDDVLLARGAGAQNRRLFQAGTPLEFTLTADFTSINRERTPNNTARFLGVLTVDGADIPVKLGSRGHLRLSSKTCEFVPIKLEFVPDQIAGTVFDGQTSLKLGTHCRDGQEFDQYVMREYLAYKLANLVTPLSFRARLARATYIDARTKKKLATHNALFLEHENDVARRLGAREVRVPPMVFSDFDRGGLTTRMLLEYMLGHTDYFDLGAAQCGDRRGQEAQVPSVPYDFDLSGMVHTVYGRTSAFTSAA